MPYGILKVDTITFTAGGVDTSVSISGLVQNPTFTGNITSTGTISGNIIQGGTTVSGATVTGTAGQFGTLTGNTAGFTTVTGTTITGTTANLVTVSGTTVTGGTARFTTLTGISGVFTTAISGATVTGNTGQFTVVTGGTAGFTTVTGTTVTGTTANFTTLSGTTATITSGVFASGTAAAPSVSVGTTTNGLFSSGANQVAISTNGTGRLFIDSSGRVGVGINSPGVILDIRETATGATTAISLFNTDNTNSTSQTARIGLSPDSRGAALTGLEAYKENSDFSTSAARDVSLALNVLLNNAKSEAVRITSAGLVGVGTSSPSSLMHLQTTSTNVVLQMLENNGSTVYGASIDAFNSSGGNIRLRLHDSGGTYQERLRITSTGNVGIGTSSPGGLLEVKSADQNPNIFRLYNAYNAGSSSWGVDFYRDTDSGNNLSVAEIKAVRTGGNASELKFGTSSTPGTVVERLRITSAGNVGIGTTSPTRSLMVAAGSASSNGILVTGSNSPSYRIEETSGSVAAQFGLDSSASYFGTSTNHPQVFNTNATERARIDTSGRLLVGTSTARANFFNAGATAQVQIEGTDADKSAIASINVANTAGGGRIYLAKGRGGAIGSNTVVQNGDTLGIITFQGNDGTEFVEGANIEVAVDGTPGANDMPGRLVFSTTRDGQSSPSEAARILNNQSILVGKTAEDATSTGITLAGANSSFAGQVLAVSSTDAGIFYRKTTSAGSGVILTKSDIGGTNTLVGAGYANGTFGAVSDATKKKNIETARNYLDDIKNIRVVKYNWNTDEDGTPKELGWIAQEVEQVFPGMVTEMEGAKLLKKEVFVPMLMKCIQEQQAIIENLEARLTALESA